jgi:lipopolysaccharide/colanic/teichoic acid biosynthesis glycosyltransferase
MAIVALAVLAALGRPVLFRQARVDRDGAVLSVYKVRTMRPDRRQQTAEFSGEDRRRTHKHPDDPRLSPVGRFCRRWSLDELPQLFNVLHGEMSRDGPRPELVDIVAHYEPWQHERQAVKPGITGSGR